MPRLVDRDDVELGQQRRPPPCGIHSHAAGLGRRSTRRFRTQILIRLGPAAALAVALAPPLLLLLLATRPLAGCGRYVQSCGKVRKVHQAARPTSRPSSGLQPQPRPCSPAAAPCVEAETIGVGGRIAACAASKEASPIAGAAITSATIASTRRTA